MINISVDFLKSMRYRLLAFNDPEGGLLGPPPFFKIDIFRKISLMTYLKNSS